jgi:hypothetical protein
VGASSQHTAGASGAGGSEICREAAEQCCMHDLHVAQFACTDLLLGQQCSWVAVRQGKHVLFIHNTTPCLVAAMMDVHQTVALAVQMP